MLPLIRDLHAHQAWADAELFHMIAATPAAQQDDALVKLLNHMNKVYRFFVLSVQGEAPSPEEMQRELPLEELQAEMRKMHRLADSYLPKLRESRLGVVIRVPWFQDFQPTTQDALVQAVMHSQNHRGQLLMMLRHLGAKTKTLDYIVWVKKGRPSPEWDVLAIAGS
jgi:uncharacterized damage-inducible protein DinB